MLRPLLYTYTITTIFQEHNYSQMYIRENFANTPQSPKIQKISLYGEFCDERLFLSEAEKSIPLNSLNRLLALLLSPQHIKNKKKCSLVIVNPDTWNIGKKFDVISMCHTQTRFVNNQKYWVYLITYIAAGAVSLAEKQQPASSLSLFIDLNDTLYNHFCLS